MNKYPFGTSVEVDGSFEDKLGRAYDPATVMCKIRDPDFIETTFTFGTDMALVKDVTGKYSMWMLPNKAGTWGYRFVGANPQSVADEEFFEVTASRYVSP